jgi:hypothetical protein
MSKLFEDSMEKILKQYKENKIDKNAAGQPEVLRKFKRKQTLSDSRKDEKTSCAKHLLQVSKSTEKVDLACSIISKSPKKTIASTSRSVSRYHKSLAIAETSKLFKYSPSEVNRRKNEHFSYLKNQNEPGESATLQIEQKIVTNRVEVISQKFIPAQVEVSEQNDIAAGVSSSNQKSNKQLMRDLTNQLLTVGNDAEMKEKTELIMEMYKACDTAYRLSLELREKIFECSKSLKLFPLKKWSIVKKIIIDLKPHIPSE